MSRLGRKPSFQLLPRDLVLTELTAQGPRRVAAMITWNLEDEDKVVKN